MSDGPRGKWVHVRVKFSINLCSKSTCLTSTVGQNRIWSKWTSALNKEPFKSLESRLSRKATVILVTSWCWRPHVDEWIRMLVTSLLDLQPTQIYKTHHQDVSSQNTLESQAVTASPKSRHQHLQKPGLGVVCKKCWLQARKEEHYFPRLKGVNEVDSRVH